MGWGGGCWGVGAQYVANELMWQASLERGHTVDQTLTVIDATDIKISSLTKTVLKEKLCLR